MPGDKTRNPFLPPPPRLPPVRSPRTHSLRTHSSCTHSSCTHDAPLPCACRPPPAARSSPPCPCLPAGPAALPTPSVLTRPAPFAQSLVHDNAGRTGRHRTLPDSTGQHRTAPQGPVHAVQRRIGPPCRYGQRLRPPQVRTRPDVRRPTRAQPQETGTWRNILRKSWKCSPTSTWNC